MIKKLFFPFYALIIRPLNARNLRNFYYSVFKYQSFKLLLSNDFTTKNSDGTQIQYFSRQDTQFPHPVGIVIGRDVVLGKKVTIHQGVTIGGKAGHKEQPYIGDNAIIYANAVIAGPVSVGERAVIGANSVVVKDVPAGAVVAGVPAKIVGQNE
ncbi:serine O-acetyltransferase [Salinivibrio costicola]|uniref:Serine acetyltransferase n=1 Tax=Salinivibrio costicola TaxID=51367 RepID=A0ABX6K4B8_SALCS|nr:serine acetyltransferase [Salinivibrio costicola]QIR06017.1 serine acetyltransferase [Salinivibrio costicola]